MKTVTADEFGKPLLAWARDQFKQEVLSDFQRIQQFDGSRAKMYLDLLRRQSPIQLAILAHVLPLEVLWETPPALERRRKLGVEERAAVEKLWADYKAEHYAHFNSNVQKRRDARHSPEIKQLFRETAKEGSRIHKQIAKEKNLEPATAGPGEWGLIGRRSWGRFVISINLGIVGMSLSYRMAVYNATPDVIRDYDHYLRVLGIGAGNWSVKDKSELNEKFVKAADFALWHANEYDVLINSILAGES